MAFEELKQRQGVMWGSGPFERVEDMIADVHDALVERVAVEGGEPALDVACGTGAISMRLARAGADVTGVDLAPALIETATRRAAEEGLSIRYDVGDCEQLPYEDASFDVVTSSFGAMFAPDHEAAGRELARVCRPGGRLGLATWRPGGGIGDLFRLTGSFGPPPPPGAGNPLEWGREEHVERLLGDAFELSFEGLDSTLVADSAQKVWELMSVNFGPLKSLLDTLDAEKRAELDRRGVELHGQGGRDGRVEFSRTYLLTSGRRRS